MDFVPITSSDRKVMLDTIGVSSFEDLIQSVPKIIPRANLKVPAALSEPELLRHCGDLAGRNRVLDPESCFLGAGAYSHWIPSVVRYITSRGEFLTAYTPYQAEASQGTLQAMYEFQSLLCELTGMDVANASLYEGASALAEACLLATRETGRSRVVIARSVHPEYRQTVQTYLKQSGIRVVQLEVPHGALDPEAAKAQVDSNTAALVVQMPNAFGCLESVEELSALAHAQGALFITVVNPISLGILKPPGSYGADIAVGEGQPLGTDLNYGGPYLGLFACRKELLRKVPGRIIGMTRDSHGRRGFTLTLQTREQHIRRAKATSNICTNEAMMALGAAVYLGALGKEGFRELAMHNLQKSHYCRDRLTEIPGVRQIFPGSFFNEFALEMPVDPERLNRNLLQEGVLGGFPLKRWDRRFENGWLVCVTEIHHRAAIDRFVEAVQKGLR
ncbi:MAG: aminomethyl-transferring glycine dehydrogenase subunit GcvPA [Candidatus Omnitrophota bacterium]|nr:aminomethyl-transferring glycine dehydrogenase subunit GcvPA [Candidatus Omnitrophota bacterium]